MAPKRKLPVVRELQCPSAQPEMPGAVAFGLIDHHGDAPTTTFLEAAVPVTPELLELAAPLPPAQVFRFAAPCQQQRCSHWQGACSLADRIVDLLPAASDAPPPCRIRADCRWYAEQGRPACARCPQVVTESTRPSELMARTARPPTPPAALPSAASSRTRADR